MQALAQFVMRGRLQAAIVVILGAGTGFLFWLSAAAVALVTLRKGPQEGGLLLAIAVIPAGIAAAASPPIGLFTVIGAFLGAYVLRASVSWVAALMTTAVAGLVLAAVMQFGFADYVQNLLEQNQVVVEQLLKQQQSDASIPPEQQLEQKQNLKTVVGILSAMTPAQITGVLGTAASLFASLSLLLGRYWQAALYNPGGFREEFHTLRLPWQVCTLCVFGALLLLGEGAYAYWFVILLVPLLINGIALIHWLVARFNLGTPAIVVFYMMLLLIGPFSVLVMALAIVDSVINFRARLAKDGGPKGT